jgi:hypothetical protein
MNKTSKKFIRRVAAPLVLAIVTAAGAHAQASSKPKPWLTPDAATVAPTTMPAPKADPEAVEKSIKVDSKVNLWLNCVVEGTVTVNGWKRNEVRVLVRDGSKFDFRVIDKDPQSGAPNWVKIVGTDAKQRTGPNSDCMTAGEISIDVPATAEVKIQGREISTSIDSVNRVEIKSIGGDISLRNIANGISANANQGDITVQASQGTMSLETTTGNILVFECAPSQIADTFTARTNNGAVALQHLKFRQVNVNSITGSLAYTGEIRSGATYNLRTTKGSIKLAIPPTSSFQLWATYGFGEFACEMPINLSTENVAPGSVKTITGKMGSGDGILKLATTNGSIGIRKL